MITLTRRTETTLLLFCFITIECMAQKSLCINEVCVANIDRFIDPSYDYGGWVELYNPTAESVDLKDMYLRHTDSDDVLEQCKLTASHGSVAPGGYAVLWFDHNSADGNYGAYAGTQIPFKMDADGGLLEITDSNGTLLDAVEYPECIARCSWMRTTDGADSFGWTNQPTPMASNNTSSTASERLEAPVVSCTGGIFTGSYRFSVEIPDNTSLYYTTDCSVPDAEHGKLSTDGLFSGNKDTVYRLILVADGYINSPVVTRSFFSSKWQFSLPVLSVSTAPENFFDDTIGVYVTGTNGRTGNNSRGKCNQNMDWERPVNMEYFVPAGNSNYSEALNQECNFAVFGGWTRFNKGNEDFEYRTSFKLKSDKIFEGENSFSYPLFDSKPYIKIKNFLVRNGGQDANYRLWDASIQQILQTSGVYLDGQAWQPSHVFLNGKYLGMLNLREESNKQFAFSNYGIEKDEIDQWENDIVIKEGDMEKLNEWYTLSTKLSIHPKDTSIWNRICDLVDIDEYCNYMAAEIYSGNIDWLRGGLKNVKGFRARDDGGKFHLVMHDIDNGFGDNDMILKILNNGTGSLPVRFKNMLKYEPFRKQFIDAYCIMDGSIFEPGRCREIITAMKDIINPALKLEGVSADERAEDLIGRIGDTETRRPALKKNLKTAFSLGDEYSVSLQSNVPEARLLLNGQDIPTGKFNGYMFPPVTLTSSAPEGWHFKQWTVNGNAVARDSILLLSETYPIGTYSIEAVYEHAESSYAPVRINEVSAGNDIFVNEYGKKADWLELYNNTDKAVDLADFYLSDDPQDTHKFRISAPENVSTVLPAHGYSIVWCDGKESLSQLHASFKLKNDDGSFVSVSDANDNWTDSLYYKEQPRWFTYGRYPDGGKTLTLFERPTIGKSNRICTSTLPKNSVSGIATALTSETEKRIAEIRYYNLNGQQISRFEGEHFVIQKTIYDNGTFKSRKIVLDK